MRQVHRVPCTAHAPEAYRTAVPALLAALDAFPVLSAQARILIKPNCVNTSPFPVTSHPEFVAAVVESIRATSKASIVVGDGTGEANLETPAVFDRLGYTAMADRVGVELVDLNTAPLRTLRREDCPLYPELHLPELALESFVISLPVLKAHSLATVTGSVKNLMGLLPPKHYSGQHGSWKKSLFHGHMQESLIEMARYILPDLSLMDATLGLCQYHLGGPTCDPAPELLLGSFDAMALDREACRLIGVDWRQVGHLARTEHA